MRDRTPTTRPLLDGVARLAALVSGGSAFVWASDGRLLAAAGPLAPASFPLASERAHIVHDASRDPRLAHLPAVQEAGVRLWASFPIFTERGLEGRLEIADTTARALGEEALAGIGDLCAQAAGALAAQVGVRSVIDSALSALPLPCFTMHVDDAGVVRLVQANQAGQRVTCQPAEMLYGRPIEEVLPWSIEHGVAGWCATTLATNRPQSVEIHFPLGEQGGLLFNVTLNPLGGRQILVVVEDRSELQELERRKNAFVANISHELRTPLATVSAAIGMLAGGVGGPLPTSAAQLVALAREGTDRLARTLQDVLDVESIRSGVAPVRREPVELPALLAACQEAVARRAAASRVTVLTGSVPQTRVFGDGERLAQAVTNLLSNAVRVSPPGWAVTVDAWMPEPSRVRLAIHDGGPPLSSEERLHLFTLFPPSPNGEPGLGLAIARLVIEAHGGAIGAHPEAGRGTAWWIDLPVLNG